MSDVDELDEILKKYWGYSLVASDWQELKAKINRLIVEAKRNTLQDVERIMFEWTLSRLIDLKKGISTIAEIEEMCYAGLRNSGNLENQLGENKGENI